MKRVQVAVVIALGAALVRPATAAEAPPGEAVVLLDGTPPDAARTSWLAYVIARQVVRKWKVVAGTVPELPRPDPACSGEAARRILEDATTDLAEGHRLFFEETALDRAETVLARAVGRILDHPCVLSHSPEAADRILAGAVLLVRVRMYGSQAEAAALARRIAIVFPGKAVDALDVPPEVERFLAGVRRDVESVQAALTVRVAPTDAAADVDVAVDGQPLARPWNRVVPAGPHEIAVFRPDGTAATLRLVTADRPVTAQFDLVLAGALQAGPSGTLIRSGGPGPEAVARRVAEVTDRTVLDVEGAATDRIRVSSVSPAAVRTDLMVLHPDGASFDVSVSPGAPTLARPAWPWPWVAAGAAAGLLGAGIGLNVASNQAAAAVQDRVAARDSYRAEAITCYALAGAGAVTSILLFVLRPPPATHFRVTPARAGTAF